MFHWAMIGWCGFEQLKSLWVSHPMKSCLWFITFPATHFLDCHSTRVVQVQYTLIKYIYIYIMYTLVGMDKSATYIYSNKKVGPFSTHLICDPRVVPNGLAISKFTEGCSPHIQQLKRSCWKEMFVLFFVYNTNIIHVRSITSAKCMPTKHAWMIRGYEWYHLEIGSYNVTWALTNGNLKTRPLMMMFWNRRVPASTLTALCRSIHLSYIQ